MKHCGLACNQSEVRRHRVPIGRRPGTADIQPVSVILPAGMVSIRNYLFSGFQDEIGKRGEGNELTGGEKVTIGWHPVVGRREPTWILWQFLVRNPTRLARLAMASISGAGGR